MNIKVVFRVHFELQSAAYIRAVRNLLWIFFYCSCCIDFSWRIMLDTMFENPTTNYKDLRGATSLDYMKQVGCIDELLVMRAVWMCQWNGADTTGDVRECRHSEGSGWPRWTMNREDCLTVRVAQTSLTALLSTIQWDVTSAAYYPATLSTTVRQLVVAVIHAVLSGVMFFSHMTPPWMVVTLFLVINPASALGHMTSTFAYGWGLGNAHIWTQM